MAVREAARTVTVPTQAGPADRPLPTATAPVPAADRSPGRPMSAEERQFTIGIIAMALVLNAIIGVGLVLSEHVWG